MTCRALLHHKVFTKVTAWADVRDLQNNLRFAHSFDVMLETDADINCKSAEICVIRRHLTRYMSGIDKISFHNEVLERTVHQSSLVCAIHGEVTFAGLVEMKGLNRNFVPLFSQSP